VFVECLRFESAGVRGPLTHLHVLNVSPRSHQDPIWLNLVLAGTASSTNSTYAARQRGYLDFCRVHRLAPLPASEETLLDLCAHLHGLGLQASSINGHLAAIRHLHVINGFPFSTVEFERLKLARKGMAVAKSPRPLRAPITARELCAFLPLLDLNEFDDSLFFALSCLGFFGFLRVGELLAPGPGSDPSRILTLADLTWLPGRLTILLKASKGDPRRNGVSVALALAPGPVCPLKALLKYLVHRTARLPLVPPSTSPLFLTQAGLPVSKPWFSARLADLARSVGVQGLVKPHSLRIGAATAAWRAGFTDSQIKHLGRWKSSAFLRYLRPSPEDLASLSANLAMLA
jgi:hypothetical protein